MDAAEDRSLRSYPDRLDRRASPFQPDVPICIGLLTSESTTQKDGEHMNFRTGLAALALVAVLAPSVALAHTRGPYQTTAWANKKLRMVHYWQDYHVVPTTVLGIGPCFVMGTTRRTAAGAKTAKHFGCFLKRYDGSKVFTVTLHTLPSRPYFVLTKS